MSRMDRVRIDIPTEELADACRRAGISRLWLFGSVVREDFGADSDIDVLVETDRGRGLFVLGGLAMDLRDLFGREVHLTTLGGVPPEQRDDLLAKAELAYAA